MGIIHQHRTTRLAAPAAIGGYERIRRCRSELRARRPYRLFPARLRPWRRRGAGSRRPQRQRQVQPAAADGRPAAPAAAGRLAWNGDAGCRRSRGPSRAGCTTSAISTRQAGADAPENAAVLGPAGGRASMPQAAVSARWRPSGSRRLADVPARYSLGRPAPPARPGPPARRAGAAVAAGRADDGARRRRRRPPRGCHRAHRARRRPRRRRDPRRPLSAGERRRSSTSAAFAAPATMTGRFLAPGRPRPAAGPAARHATASWPWSSSSSPSCCSPSASGPEPNVLARIAAGRDLGRGPARLHAVARTAVPDRLRGRQPGAAGAGAAAAGSRGPGQGRRPTG